MKVLLLEDDFSTNAAIVHELEAFGFIVDSCLDGECAMDMVHQKQHDLYVLDINVPNFDGYEVLEFIIERYPNALTIMISTHIEIEYLKKAFILGSNDFLKKPFEIEELLLRIRNIMRLANPQGNKEVIDLSQGYTYSLLTGELLYYDLCVKLTKKESLLLRLLVQNLGNIVSFENIKNYVWDNEEEVSLITVRYWICALIKKLKNGMIVNVRGDGYRLRKLSH
ncbi:MAG: response regulator transcription factor [Sulfurimonas sp.]|uniref:response regulator transcription factor n=1 Tax=Sulfurimonas sp. TaxID=2022749 RepID=UPI0026181C38|nr:response regulator transcription factor [Sulfurimonas sp.]MDD5400003.1 response regulator transcription factor [Sulfurimonas sp.]